MIIDLISLLISMVIWFFVMLGVIYVLVFIFSERFRTKGKKREVKLMNDFKKKIKELSKISWDYLWSFGNMFTTICLSSLLAIGIKPIIYKLNYPLGEGYATFASYVIAILLYVMLRGENKK